MRNREANPGSLIIFGAGRSPEAIKNSREVFGFDPNAVVFDGKVQMWVPIDSGGGNTKTRNSAIQIAKINNKFCDSASNKFKNRHFASNAPIDRIAHDSGGGNTKTHDSAIQILKG